MPVQQHTPWRLIIDPQPASGAWNMAVDEAVFELMDSGQSLPTLRLYTWTPPCLSLGLAQPVSDVNLVYLAQSRWELVRRPTGGRAILHTDEITYSVIGPLGDPRLSGTVIESYQKIGGALLKALNIIGLEAEMAESAIDPNKKLSPVCFEVPSIYEMTVAGKKILGSAQARRRKSLLQHGSLPLFGDLTRITHCLVFEDETDRQKAAARLLEHATNVKIVTGKQIAWDEATSAFIEGFEEKLNLKLLPGSLSRDELALAEKLYTEKYNNIEWCQHR
jgi:lipoyl(octanoyl) transferase